MLGVVVFTEVSEVTKDADTIAKIHLQVGGNTIELKRDTSDRMGGKQSISLPRQFCNSGDNFLRGNP